MKNDEPGVGVTTAVIVAAGIGRRLRSTDDRPKPLVPVAGVPLVQRVMASAAKSGIRRFVVVVGYEAERMRLALPDLVPEGCTIDLLENPRFEDPNGVSLNVAAAHVAGPFALLMSDHLFSPDRLALALEAFASEGRSLLVIESRAHFDGDLDDATRVRIDEGSVRAIAKHLSPYDAVDTGMFVLRDDRVRWALGRAGDAPSISDGMRVLAESGELAALEIEQGYWQDVNDAADMRRAEQKLYRSLRKETDGFLARHREPPDLPLREHAALATGHRTQRGDGVHPAAGSRRGLGLRQGSRNRLGPPRGATLFQLQSILDGVDGELARLLHRESRFGFYFDVGVDNVTHMAVFGGIARAQIASGNFRPVGGPGRPRRARRGGVFRHPGPAAQEIPGTRPKSSAPPPGLLGRIVDGLARRDFSYLLFPLALVGGLGAFLWAAAIGTWTYAGLALFLRLRSRGAKP